MGQVELRCVECDAHYHADRPVIGRPERWAGTDGVMVRERADSGGSRTMLSKSRGLCTVCLLASYVGQLAYVYGVKR